jgi:hypothetical protein
MEWGMGITGEEIQDMQSTFWMTAQETEEELKRRASVGEGARAGTEVVRREGETLAEWVGRVVDKAERDAASEPDMERDRR